MFSTTILLASIIATSVLCAIIGYFFHVKVVHKLQLEYLKLANENAALTASQEQQQNAIKLAQSQMLETFTNLSNKSLQQNSDAFIKLAAENLKQFQMQSKNDIEKKEKAINDMLKPITDALDKTAIQINSIEKDRKQAYGSLTQHLRDMSETQKALQGETRNLVNALRRPEVRGQWGELTLRRLAELAGMVKHCDFFEQASVNSESGIQRPDMVVKMPGGRDIVVDVKTPLDAYLQAIDAKDDLVRQQQLERHSKNVKNRVRELSSKAYWNQFDNSPDFVVLFIPGDQFLSSALDVDPTLLEFAMQQKIILSTPNSFVALLRAIAYGWRQESLAENAEHIREIGTELYARLATFAEHLNKLGRSLGTSVQHYNKAVGSFDSRILTSARKFGAMGISEKNKLESIEQIEHTTRAVESLNETVAIETVTD